MSSSSSTGSGSDSVSVSSASEVYGDFNGDGFDDLAIGVPKEEIGSIQDAGAVNVIYGTSGGLSATLPRPNQFWSQGSTNIEGDPETNDRFGSSLTAGDFNGDGIDDLAVGVQSEDIGSTRDAGGVNVIYGSSGGLSATLPISDQFWSQNNPTDIVGTAGTDDRFSQSISAGDFNGDGFDDLAVGVAGEDVGSIQGAGAVNVIYGTASGLSATTPRPNQFWSQASSGIEGEPEENDNFGSFLSTGDFNGDGRDDLAIGVRFEAIGTLENAGIVHIIYGNTNGLSSTSPRAAQLWSQDSANIDEAPETNDFFGNSISTGDFNGDGRDDLAVGVWGESLGTLDDAGAVNVIYGSSNGLSATSPIPDQFWSQNNPPDIVGTAGPDAFGRSLTAGDYNGDGRDDLAVGVPNEIVGSVVNAGAVNVIYGTANGLSSTSPRPNQFWSQASNNIDGEPELDDSFGAPLSSGDFNGDGRDELVIGVPFEDLGAIADAGAVNVIYGTSGGLSATSPRSDQILSQNDPPEIVGTPGQLDNFGNALG